MRPPTQGFTLIEMAIVLVIIGLIVGGVLVGQDLIRAAGVRATITQVEKFNTAVNTFYGKYGALPGDLNAQVANTFGFTPRGQYAGQGDGNGILEGVNGNNPGANWGIDIGAGENAMFWVDLTSANGLNVNLIEGSFSAPSPTTPPSSPVTGAALNNWLPSAKLGRGNYFYTYSLHPGCVGNGSSWWYGMNNLFGLSAITSIQTNSAADSTPALTVAEAYAIDKKTDDGVATSGNVQAMYADDNTFPGCGEGFTSNATPVTATSCFDTASGNYALAVNGGAGVNCALSFNIQGGD
jgi:prepilin-type N-terminal cleavage/methylation domain-containing protein